MENVLAVKTELLRPFLTGEGCLTDRCAEAVEVMLRNHVFLPRPEAEVDESYRQIIPYVVIRRGEHIFTTERLAKGGEARLHGKLSIGIGGHINPESDGDGSDVLRRGMARELSEEVSIGGAFSAPRFIGLINNESNSVSRVHLGLLCAMTVDGEVTVRETEKLAGRWMTAAELRANAHRLEGWTAIALDALEENA